MEEKKGFILVARKIIDSDIFTKPPLYLKVWIYILSNAFHTDSGGIKRGEFITSIKEIQEACTYYVGYRKEVPTKKQIYSILEYLRNPCERNTKGTMIETTKVTHGMLIKVLNYSVYQDFKNYESNNEGITKSQRTERQGNNKKKALKNTLENIKNKREYGELKNVLLTDEEYEKIKQQNLLSYIDDLSFYIPNKKGVPYKDHYATILNWKRRDDKKQVQTQSQSIAQTWEQTEEQEMSEEELKEIMANINSLGGETE